eukprot:5097899-Alexandrium_andersonii.AAC.1
MALRLIQRRDIFETARKGVCTDRPQKCGTSKAPRGGAGTPLGGASIQFADAADEAPGLGFMRREAAAALR